MKKFIVSILLSLLFFGFYSAKADSSSSETSSQLINSEQAIWKIHHLGRYGNGTGFFVGPNHFITNFHIVSGLLNRPFIGDTSQDHGSENKDPVNRIVLSQEENSSILRIKRAIAVSALYDLALLETEESGTNYLSLRESHPEPSENLFLAAYPNRIFTRIKKTGDIFYEDSHKYKFPVNHFFLHGVSGSPVLDEEGLVVGVAFLGSENILSVIRIDHLKEFVGGDIGTKCSDFNFSKVCLEREGQKLKVLARKGFAFAQDRLARMYYEGVWVPQNFKKAFYWFREAAEQDYALSQYTLASMYHEGEGVDPDPTQAFPWVRRSAEQGYVPAKYSLARAYQRGGGVNQNLGEALKWMRESAEQGLAQAQYDLAFMYYEAKGVQKDLDQALYWFERSAEQNYASAQGQLALMYYEGEENFRKDFDQAFHWAEKAARQDYMPAKYQLALMYYFGEGTQRDLDQAFHWAKAAVEQGYLPARLLLFLIEEKRLEGERE